MPSPGFEPGSSRPQREVLTPILSRPGDIGYRSRYLSHAKRALYHLSYIPMVKSTADILEILSHNIHFIKKKKST